MLKKLNKVIPAVLILIACMLVLPAFAQQTGIVAEGTWVSNTAKTLSNPVIETVLLVIGLLGLLIEIITMSAVAGAIGLVVLIIFFLSHIALGAPIWLIFVFIGGVIFLCFEIFVAPGHGITGAIGLVATMISVYMALEPERAAFIMVLSIIISTVIFAVIFKSLPKTKAWQRLTLTMKQSSSEGYNSLDRRVDLEGAVGIAASDLRPAGVVIINDERIDVTTSGGFIKKDSPVRVVKVEGMRVIVKEADL